MAHDPKARVVSIGDFSPYTDPTYGPGAVRRVTYEDGTVEYRFFHYDTQQNQQGAPDEGYLVREAIVPDLADKWETKTKEKTPPARTPEAEAHDKAVVEADRRKAEDDARKAEDADRETKEKQYNASHPGPDGKAYYETHAERALREQKEAADARAVEAARRAEEDQQAQRRAEVLAQQNQARANETAAGNLEVSRGQLALAQTKDAREANKPDFLNQANDSNPYLIRYNPQTGQVEQMGNPNFDAVKQESERQRQLIATQIQARQLSLEEGKQAYSQWYDTNVKTPLALAQEAREKAQEQRAALDAEEKRRQFASDFQLRKASLGQQAGAAAMQAEESLLPYRAGPNEAADMSSAINSLAAGGSMSTNASAGIHFQPSDFEFNAPDFKSIAKKAAADALKGISNYTPSSEGYSTADYSGVPQVNTSGAPATPSGYGSLQQSIDNLSQMYQYGGQGATRP
jgi:hypothetical protein